MVSSRRSHRQDIGNWWLQRNLGNSDEYRVGYGSEGIARWEELLAQ
jgi:hypothetical protein